MCASGKSQCNAHLRFGAVIRRGRGVGCAHEIRQEGRKVEGRISRKEFAARMSMHKRYRKRHSTPRHTATVEGEVFKGVSYPLCHGLPFVQCLSPSHLTPCNKVYPLIWSEYLNLQLPPSGDLTTRDIKWISVWCREEEQMLCSEIANVTQNCGRQGRFGS